MLKSLSGVLSSLGALIIALFGLATLFILWGSTNQINDLIREEAKSKSITRVNIEQGIFNEDKGLATYTRSEVAWQITKLLENEPSVTIVVGTTVVPSAKTYTDLINDDVLFTTQRDAVYTREYKYAEITTIRGTEYKVVEVIYTKKLG